MFCPSCGQPVAASAKYCPACGATLAGGAVAAPAPGAAWAPAAGPVAGAEATVRYGGFWRRLLGLIVDRLLIGIVTLPIGIAFGIGFFMPWGLTHEEITPEAVVRLIFGSLTLAWIRAAIECLYAALLQSSAWQGTVGQMVVGVKVTDVEGRRITALRAVGRYVASILSGLFLGLGFLWCAFDPKKRTWHDHLAGTLVVRR